MGAFIHRKFDFDCRNLDEKWRALFEGQVNLWNERLEYHARMLDEREARAKEQFDRMNQVHERLANARLRRFELIVNQIKESNVCIQADMAAIKENNAEVIAEARREARSVKTIVVTTAIGSVMAIAGFNATVLSNMVASYESGKSTAAAITQATERLDRLQERTEKTAALVDAWYAQMTEQDGTIKKPSKR
jgi:altronate dehydratase